MLSTKTLTSSGQASHYFMGTDNYYAKDSIEAKEQSGWYGKGAALLGLEGTIESDQFNELLEGLLPTGQKLGVVKDGVRKHRPGFDLTFSVPKSVSIVGLMGNDQRILQAIDQSVDKVLAVIEKEAAQARMTQQGETVYEDTGNIVAAKFLHDLSRECDPQLHIHTVVMNMTQRRDGNWRALASQMGKYGQEVKGEVNGFIERVRHQKKYYGLLFSAELAFALKELGYELDINKKTGQFEIAGISEASIKTFSQRREQIEKVMKEKGFTSAKAAAVVTLETRKNKEEVDRAQLRETWKARAKDRQIDPFAEAKNAVDNSLQPKSLDEKSRSHEAYDAGLLTQVLLDLSQNEPTFTRNQLMNRLLQTHLDKFVSLDAAQAHLDRLVKENRLFIRMTEKGDTVYVTQERIESEKHVVLNALQKRESLSSKRQDQLQRAVTKSSDSSIAVSIAKAIHSDSLIHGIEVVSESQKLNSIVPLVKLSQAAGLQPVILSASAKSSQKMHSVIQSQYGWFKQFISNLTDNSQTLTVNKFLYCMKNEVYQSFFNGSHGALILEDAEKLSIESMNDLIRIAKKTDSKIIPVFNNQGMKHWSNSSAIDLLRKSGVLVESLPNQERVLSEKTVISIERLPSFMESTLPHASEERALEALVDHANQSVRSNVSVHVVMPNQRLAKQFNDLTRLSRLEKGWLGPEQVHATQLLPVYLTRAEYASSHSYKVGQVVRFNESYPSIHVDKEAYLKVVASNDRSNLVVLETDLGEKIVWNPNKVGGRKQGAVELFDEVAHAIHIGEKIKMSRSLKYKGVVSGDVMTVTGLKDNKIIALTDQGKRITLNLGRREEQHYAYSYCDTAYASIPKNTDVILTYHSGNASPVATNMIRSLMTHTDKKLWCYTVHADKLVAEIKKSLPEARYALDTVMEKKSDNNYVVAVKEALKEGIQPYFSEQAESVASEAIVYAMKHLSEREAAFTQNELLSVAIKNLLGTAAPNELHDALHRAETSGYLVPGVVSRDGKLWTTLDALVEERDLLTIAKNGVRQLAPISTPIGVETDLKNTHVSEEQAQAIKTLCTNTNRVLPIQGLAGVGKTTMMKAFVDICHKNHHEVILLAPTHTAVKELRANGLNAQTVDAFLKANPMEEQRAKATNHVNDHTHDHLVNKKYPIFILDEATMASTKRQAQLAKMVESKQGKFIPVGDVFQFSSIEAGKVHENLQSLGIDVIKMTDIQRQRDNPELLSAVRSTYALDYQESFAKLGDKIIESGAEMIGNQSIDNPDARLRRMAEEFVHLDPNARSHMLMITLSNAERSLLNDQIRQGLIAKGELGETVTSSSILKSKDMTQMELTRASHYAVNDVILFGMSDRSLGVEKGEYVRVLVCDVKKNQLMLERKNGEKVVYPLPNSRSTTPLAISVYHQEKRELRKGDWIRWTKSNPALGLLSPEYALVTHIEGNNAFCQPMAFTKEGAIIEDKVITIRADDAEYSHWDYAYAVTNYASQGRSIQSVRASFPSAHPMLTTQRAFLVTVTRAISDITIYTDDKSKLLTHLMNTTGDKTSALEAVGELKPMDKKSVIAPQKTADQIETVASEESNVVHKSEPKTSQIDSQSLRIAMNDQSEKIAMSLLGEPKERHGNTLRFGTHKGSLIVTIKGEKQGLWHDFQTGKGGDMLRLFAEQRGLTSAADYPHLLNEASQYLGVDFSNITAKKTSKNASQKTQEIDKGDPKNWTEYQKKQVAKANKLARESLPITGTIVEHYLKEHRKIDLKTWPETIRFHPNIYCAMNKKSAPAMLLLGKDKDGNIQVVQATFLDNTTKNKQKNIPVSKQTIGVMYGAAVHLSLSKEAKKEDHDAAKTYIAEGVETGLSVLMADQKNEVKVTLGQSNFLSIHALDLQKKVVFCFDHDAKSSPEIRFKEEAEKLESLGKKVTYLKPKQVGHDLNDVLKKEGMNALKSMLQAQKSFDSKVQKRAEYANIISRNKQRSQVEKVHCARQISQEKSRSILQKNQQPQPQKGFER